MKEKHALEDQQFKTKSRWWCWIMSDLIVCIII